MQNLFNNTKFAVGIEPEFYGKTPGEMNRINNNQNSILGLTYKHDGSQGVSAEADLPALAPGRVMNNYLNRVYEQISANNNKVTFRTGTHVHVSTMPIKENLSNDDFSNLSIELKQRHLNNGRHSSYLTIPEYRQELFQDNIQIPVEVIKDVLYRISKHRVYYNSLLVKSRRDDRNNVIINGVDKNIQNAYFCRLPKSPTEILNCNSGSIQELIRCTNSYNSLWKYSTLNLLPYIDKKTIEFRSHSGTLETHKINTWILFLLNMINHSLQTRFKTNEVIEQLTSPEYIGRSTTTIKSMLWNFCRVSGGRSVQEIMAHTGINNAQSVRRTISEIRVNPEHEQFIVCHNQQEYGIAYGQSNNYSNNGYEVLINKNVNRPNSNRFEFITERMQRGHSILTANLDNQVYSNLQEFIRVRQ
jgi:hypothetical protein